MALLLTERRFDPLRYCFRDSSDEKEVERFIDEEIEVAEAGRKSSNFYIQKTIEIG